MALKNTRFCTPQNGKNDKQLKRDRYLPVACMCSVINPNLSIRMKLKNFTNSHDVVESVSYELLECQKWEPV